MAKVLILGSNGTLGQALMDAFNNDSYEVIAWTKNDLDITSPTLYSKIEDLSPNIIINSTAYNDVNKMETDEEGKKLGFAINAEAPTNLAKVANKIDAIFVHYSTDYVFDGDTDKGYKEDDKPNPQSLYGRSKLEGEEGVQNNSEKFYIIRLSRLFGKRGSSEGSKKTFVEKMLEEINKEDLTVGNTEISLPTYAPDLAKFTRELIESKAPFGIYHGSNSDAATWYDWATEIFKVLGKGPKVTPSPVSLTPSIVKHPHYSVLLNTKFEEQRSWKDALAEFLRIEQ